jgi:hypothetical protein
MTTLNNFPLLSLYGGWKKTLVNKCATVMYRAVCHTVYGYGRILYGCHTVYGYCMTYRIMYSTSVNGTVRLD